MNLDLAGLQRNYSKLGDDIKKADNMIQDPDKNSRYPYRSLTQTMLNVLLK